MQRRHSWDEEDVHTDDTHIIADQAETSIHDEIASMILDHSMTQETESLATLLVCEGCNKLKTKNAVVRILVM